MVLIWAANNFKCYSRC